MTTSDRLIHYRYAIRQRDDLINEAINILRLIANGRGYAGEEIDRAKFADEVEKYLSKKWDACSNDPS